MGCQRASGCATLQGIAVPLDCEALMLLTLTCAAPDAPRFGFLFGKHPDSLYERPFSLGTVRVFYSQVTPEAVTLVVLVEVDPVALVRRPGGGVGGLDQYVNDRPYVASSITSVALNTALGGAMSGKNERHPDLVRERPRWEVRLPAIACDAWAEFITRVFTPLGYEVGTTRQPLDPTMPAWGESDIYSVVLAGEQAAADVLSHLYVLLPVLDNSKHYYIGQDEIDKLLAHGGAWLASHPERELITRRYLRYRRPLVDSALARLVGSEEAEAEEPKEAAIATEERALPGLHAQRLAAVMASVREVGAQSLVDLGCGEGRLLELALQEPGLRRIFGIDVSTRALGTARRRLHLETMAPAQRERITLAQGSTVYRDDRLAGYDAAALVEVIEHLDADRLDAMERVVFGLARPRRVVVTTPNREYNSQWASLTAGTFRHGDHRFEWTRAEARDWAERVSARYGYTWRQEGIGPEAPEVGTPSQLLVFDRDDRTNSPATATS